MTFTLYKNEENKKIHKAWHSTQIQLPFEEVKKQFFRRCNRLKNHCHLLGYLDSNYQEQTIWNCKSPLLPSCCALERSPFMTTKKSFQTRYCLTPFLKGHRECRKLIQIQTLKYCLKRVPCHFLKKITFCSLSALLMPDKCSV